MICEVFQRYLHGIRSWSTVVANCHKLHSDETIHTEKKHTLYREHLTVRTHAHFFSLRTLARQM